MRLIYLVALVLLMPATTAKADITAACYSDCEAENDSNVEFKACLSRAANKADRLLNQGYEALQEAVRKAAKEMDQPPESQLKALTDAQKKWIDFPDANCAFEDGLAFGGTATGGNCSACFSALSYERVTDFDRIKQQIIGE